MIYSLTLAVTDLVPSTVSWNPSVAIIMSICDLLAFVIGYFAIQNPGKGPGLPLPQLSSRKSFGLPELLATGSLGHILGAGMILGLSSAGII